MITYHPYGIGYDIHGIYVGHWTMKQQTTNMVPESNQLEVSPGF